MNCSANPILTVLLHLLLFGKYCAALLFGCCGLGGHRGVLLFIYLFKACSVLI